MDERLILETDEVDRWWDVYLAALPHESDDDATGAAWRADDAIRLYRERMPAPRDPRACSDCGAIDCEVKHVSEETLASLFEDPRPPAPPGLEDRIAAAIRKQRGPTATSSPTAPDAPGWWFGRKRRGDGLQCSQPHEVVWALSEDDGSKFVVIDGGLHRPLSDYEWGGACLQGSADRWATEARDAGRDARALQARLDALISTVASHVGELDTASRGANLQTTATDEARAEAYTFTLDVLRPALRLARVPE